MSIDSPSKHLKELATALPVILAMCRHHEGENVNPHDQGEGAAKMFGNLTQALAVADPLELAKLLSSFIDVRLFSIKHGGEDGGTCMGQIQVPGRGSVLWMAAEKFDDAREVASYMTKLSDLADDAGKKPEVTEV